MMLRTGNDNERICGVLHDVIEDTSINTNMLREEGSSSDVLDALDALTKQQGESYDDSEEDFQRVEKYKKAVKRIQEHLLRYPL